ncbi:MAG: YeeE/YedE family protein [Anaerolineae bacterium]|nr:YeeE/YedE family protein [Anaerolineae bacterium]
MVGWLAQARWSPYVVGAGIGVLSWLAFLLSDRGIGCSTAFAQTAGMLERLLRGQGAWQRPYFQKVAPRVDWGWMLVLGIVLGAFASAALSGTFAWEMVPALWAQRFGASALLRWAVAFVGGVVLGFGARWAGGCTSGHGITGTLQLAVSSWLATISFFVAGIAVAHLLF